MRSARKRNPLARTGVYQACRTAGGAMNQAHKEWRAWRQVCKQLAARGVDINAQDSLACAIRMWGEELVALREEDSQYTEKALAERRAEYEPHWLEPRDA